MVEKYAREAKIEQEHSIQSRKIDIIEIKYIMRVNIQDEKIWSWPRSDLVRWKIFLGPCSFSVQIQIQSKYSLAFAKRPFMTAYFQFGRIL